MGFDLYWASIGLAVLISIFALDIMGVFSRKNYFELEGKVRFYIQHDIVFYGS